MSEKLSTRREVAAAEFERTEQQQAMRYLNRIGVTKKLSELNLFHGRAGDGSGNWQVDPSYDNAGNNTGHHNINKRTALNTSSYGVANQFSIARSRKTASVAEIHHISSEDPDAAIIDSDAFAGLDQAQTMNANSAVAITMPGITEGSPLAFEDRYAIDSIIPSNFRNRYGFMFSEDVGRLSQQLGMRAPLTHQIGSTINTRALLCHGELNTLCDAFMDNEPTVPYTDSNGNHHSIPINHEYLASWFKANHIVGYKRKVISATLGGQVIDNYLLFDLDKVNTDAEIERRTRERNQRLGQIALMSSHNTSRNRRGNLAHFLSENPYIKPEEIVQMAKETPGYKEVFESDAGNREGYTLEEHTETALRLFDRDYADKLPASLLPTMRMALLVHDLGKPEASRRHDKANQKQYNSAFADHFLRQNQVDEPTIKLIETMIGEGMNWTERWMIRKDRSMGIQYYRFCENTMKQYLGVDQVNQKTVFGFKSMLEILQECDSAAYTDMAVTRSTKNNGIVYRNLNAFNNSFESNHGIDGRRARLKRTS